MGAALAIGVGAVCLTCAAYILLARNLDPAAAWGILGAFWGPGRPALLRRRQPPARLF